MLRLPPELSELVAEGVLWQELHIFGEHREEAAHEEAGDGLSVMALALEAAAQRGEVR